ncbi:hypothetical protein YIM1640_12000 [Thermus oshimai]|jgi:hypothetical protein|uniref:Uncharacterized protein n=1 Tax=Thermus oshimai JL-2 TaxID=751945 RepID=K7R753_THEOS|nr:hypothetical protein [Thermus oshimai]AFV76759.1 hypothetical protein Theos_1739 [Thermus oshimai JL-2]
MEYAEMPYEEARKRAVRVLEDGYGDAVVLKDEHGYWALYYFYWAQTPPPAATPHWMEGPLGEVGAIRSPYEMKKFLEEVGEPDFLNDVD